LKDNLPSYKDKSPYGHDNLKVNRFLKFGITGDFGVTNDYFSCETFLVFIDFLLSLLDWYYCLWLRWRDSLLFILVRNSVFREECKGIFSFNFSKFKDDSSIFRAENEFFILDFECIKRWFYFNWQSRSRRQRQIWLVVSYVSFSTIAAPPHKQLLFIFLIRHKDWN